MKTVQQEERLALIDRVLFLSPITYIYGGLGANVGLIESEIERQVRYGALDWSAWDIQNVHRVSVSAARRGQLAANPMIVEVFQTVFSDPQFYPKSGSEANEQLILAELIRRGVYPPENPLSTENLSQVVVDLWSSLSTNPEAAAASEATRRRLRQIAEMVGDPPTHGFSIQRGPQKTAYGKDGRKHDPMHGQAQGFSMGISGPWSRGAGSKSFDEMTNEEVDALYQEWKATDNYRNMSREELRAVVRKAGPTDVFGKNVHAPSAPAPDGDVLLENPAKPGTEFTRRDLVTFINAAPYNGRNLITRNGRIVPKLRQRFEELIRGERG